MGGGIVGNIQTEIIPEDRIEEAEEDDEAYKDPGEITENLNKALDCFSKTLRELWNGYRDLTSEESIINTIEANDWEFNEDGKQY